MASDDRTELMPLLGAGQASFDAAMRGYDRRQVDDYVADLEAEIGDLRAGRDQLATVSADRAATVAAQEARIESLKHSLTQAQSAVTDATVEGRSRQLIELANAESAQVRRSATEEAKLTRSAALAAADAVRQSAGAEHDELIQRARLEADRILSDARADAETIRLEAATQQQRLVSAAAQRLAEADQRAAQSRVQSIAELDAARAEAGRTLQIATDQREHLDAQALAARELAERTSTERRRQAEEDFDITLRARRTQAQQQEQQQLVSTRQTIAGLLAQAQDQVAQLNQHRDAIHRDLEDLGERLGTVVAETDW